MLKGTASSKDSNKADPSDPIINIQLLLKIVSSLDFNTVAKHDNVLDILIRLFPDRPREELVEIERYAASLIENNVSQVEASKTQQAKNKSYSNFFMKLSFAIASTIAGAYFGAPVTAACGKTVVTQIYTILFGAPDTKSFTYGVLFVPCQKFVAYVSKKYGSYALGILAAPTAYNLASLIEYLTEKAALLGNLVKPKSAFKPSAPYSLQKADDIIAEFEVLTIASDVQESSDPVEVVMGHKALIMYPNYKRTVDKTVDDNDFNPALTNINTGTRTVNPQLK